MVTVKEVENFVFDVLGDFVDPKRDVMIQEARNEIRVIVIRTCGIPKDVIRDEWNRNIRPEFENVNLYL